MKTIIKLMRSADYHLENLRTDKISKGNEILQEEIKAYLKTKCLKIFKLQVHKTPRSLKMFSPQLSWYQKILCKLLEEKSHQWSYPAVHPDKLQEQPEKPCPLVQCGMTIEWITIHFQAFPQEELITSHVNLVKNCG